MILDLFMRKIKSLREIPSPIVLPFILIGGIILTFFRALVLQPGSASLGVFFETIYYTSFSIFYAAVFLLFIDFKRTKKSTLLWFHLILGAPLSLIMLYGVLFNFGLKFIETTTPRKFQTKKIMDPILLERYSNGFETLTDSLLDVQVIGIKADSARRLFSSKFYYDDIERKFAIDLVPEVRDLQYLEFNTSNLYYSPNDPIYLVGFITAKYTNPYAVSKDNTEGVDFNSKLFIGKVEDSNFEMIVLREYGLSCNSFERCNYFMERNFLKGKSSQFKYNINDSRFWSENNWIEKLDAHSKDLKNNVYD